MKSPTHVSSKQGMHKSTKISNTPTSSIHIVMQIISDIYLKGTKLHQQFISSMVTSYTGVPRNNLIPLETFPIHKQQQFTQEW